MLLIVLTVGVTGAVALAASWAARWLVVVTVIGSSMLPGLSDGDTVVVRRSRVASVRAGDVVVLDRPRPRTGVRPPSTALRALDGDWAIKRVAALAGDPVPGALGWPAGARVPWGRIVVLGDNRAASHDSRHFGYVDDTHLLGVVVWRLQASAGRGVTAAGRRRHPGA
jgi:signal peptidase I